MTTLIERLLIELKLDEIDLDEVYQFNPRGMNYNRLRMDHSYYKTIIINGAREISGRRLYGNAELGKVNEILDEEIFEALERFVDHYTNLMLDKKFTMKEILVEGLKCFATFKELWS